MLNYIWSGMILLGILWGGFHGRLPQVTEGALTAAREAVTLCITMLGIMSLWTGILEIGKQAGLVDSLSEKMRPFLRFMFPRLNPRSEAARQISVNFTANMLGLGWAAAPAGLKAMEELKKLEKERRAGSMFGDVSGIAPQITSGIPFKIAPEENTASNEMCTFLILNISSLQLIPMNIIAYRSQYGSTAPAAVAGPALAATFLSTAAAIVFCRIMDRKT